MHLKYIFVVVKNNTKDTDMKKKLLAISAVFAVLSLQAQVLTYVGDDATFTVLDEALVYSGGGWQNAGTGEVTNYGDIMVVGASGDLFDVASSGKFTLKFDETDASKEVYGQLYIKGVPQGLISGNVHKEFLADANTSATGKQQIGLPFYNFTILDLKNAVGSTLQVTSTALTTAGRFNPATVFVWSNRLARFDQIVGADTKKVGKPTDYFAIPRRNQSGGIVWDAANTKSTFVGMPVSDIGGLTEGVLLQTSAITNFGSAGTTINSYRERYNSYLDDPFVDKTVASNWSTGLYGERLNQFANPFLTNIDLSNIVNDTDGDGAYLSNVEGIAYYAASDLSWSAGSGTTYSNANIVMAKTNAGAFQAGDVDKLLIKPLQEVMIKFNDATIPTLNFNNTRRFAQDARVVVYAGVTTSRNANSIPSDKIVKQVAVILNDAAGHELSRTYYAVSPSAITGVSEDAKLQGYIADGFIYTKEEVASGGEDVNQTAKLYVNEANEVAFAGKEVVLKINTADAASLSFVVYEAGKKVSSLSNGRSFYIKQGSTITKIDNDGTLALNGGDLGLYYEQPEGTLGATSSSAKVQTVIAKKSNEQWIVRFASTWKSATVEVFSAAGQLLHSGKNISTSGDYNIPLSSNVNGMFIVKATSDNGEVVIKKIVK